MAKNSTSRIILGVDPGTIITGYGLIKCYGKKMELIACGSIQLGKSKTAHADRLKRLFNRLKGLMDEFAPDEMAIEAPFYGKNPQSMLKLGRAQGVAMAAALGRDMPVFEYAPRKVKMAVTGKGAASKEQVAAMLRNILKFEESPHYLDATDGLAVAVCHFFQGNPAHSSTQHKDWNAFIKANPGRIK
ncbi:MAG: crossover junction endodeoxyribonuclease RuvC [Bacteroidota bacterium]